MLNPIRAKVSLDLRVLTYQDWGLLSVGCALFMAHQVAKETMATISSWGDQEISRVRKGLSAASGIYAPCQVRLDYKTMFEPTSRYYTLPTATLTVIGRHGRRGWSSFSDSWPRRSISTTCNSCWTVKSLGHPLLQRPITYGSQGATPNAVATSRCGVGWSQNNYPLPLPPWILAQLRLRVMRPRRAQ